MSNSNKHQPLADLTVFFHGFWNYFFLPFLLASPNIIPELGTLWPRAVFFKVRKRNAKELLSYFAWIANLSVNLVYRLAYCGKSLLGPTATCYPIQVGINALKSGNQSFQWLCWGFISDGLHGFLPILWIPIILEVINDATEVILQRMPC